MIKTTELECFSMEFKELVYYPPSHPTHTHTHTHARKRTRTNAHTTHTCVHTQTHTHTPRTHTTHTRARVSHISAHVDKTKKNLRVIETRVGNFYMLQDHLTLQYSSTLERSIWDWICSVILEGSFNNIATSVYDMSWHCDGFQYKSAGSTPVHSK